MEINNLGPGDHPRMRGEHDEYLSHIFRVMGSSPHARGALRRQVVVCQRVGIIPACAGSTARLGGHVLAERDHPRMRGEHCTLLIFAKP